MVPGLHDLVHVHHRLSSARIGWLYALREGEAGKPNRKNGGGSKALVHGILPVGDPKRSQFENSGIASFVPIPPRTGLRG
jgi:hypothetical protein